MTDTPPPTTPIEPKPVQPHADQDQLMLDETVTIGQRLDLCLADADLGPLLTARGFNAARLQAGLALQVTTLDKFNLRTRAMAAADGAAEQVGAADTLARGRFQEVRDTCRALFKTAADKRALLLDGRVPDDRQQFIGLVLNMLKTVRLKSYSDQLVEFGVTGTQLDALEQAVDALKAAEMEYTQAYTAGLRATEERNAAYAALVDWHGTFAALAKVATKDRPDLEARLKF